MKPFEIRAPRSDELRRLAQLKIEWAGLDPRPGRGALHDRRRAEPPVEG